MLRQIVRIQKNVRHFFNFHQNFLIFFDEISHKSSSFSFDRKLLGAYFFGQNATTEKWMTSFSVPQGLFLSSSTSPKKISESRETYLLDILKTNFSFEKTFTLGYSQKVRRGLYRWGLHELLYQVTPKKSIIKLGVACMGVVLFSKKYLNSRH